MKVRIRMLSALLAASMLFSMSVPAWAAEGDSGAAASQSAVAGEIRATLRLDYAQNMKAIKNHNVQAFLKPGFDSKPQFDPDSATTSDPGFNLWEIGDVQTAGSYSATVTAKNRDGGVMDTATENSWPGYLELAIDGLPQGKYTLTFHGIGYATFSQNIEIKEYSRHLVIGTGDNTFTLGDLTGDGKVDQEDLNRIEEKDYLNTPPSEADLKQVGFNGDGVIDVVDLAYVKRSSVIQPAGENVPSSAELMDTLLLVPPVSVASLQQALTVEGVSVTSGDLNDLFVENGQGVQLTSSKDTVELPMEFSTERDLEQIIINTPNNNIGVKKGSAKVEYTDGTTEDLPFDATLPADVHAIGRAGEDSRSIVINLGKRVAVKKITISVEKTSTGYVAVESIQFLKDIVPENPVAPNRMVRNLKAEAGSETVSLKWSELPNITGYRVLYWEKVEDETQKVTKELNVDVPYADVSGLENLKTYCFQVVPTAADWQGDYCEAIEATPQPNKAPDAPDMVSVQELEGKLAVSWKKSKAATYYQVFFKEKGASGDYQQVGGNLTETSVTIESLENEVTYSIYIIAGNEIGKSGPSRIAEGTPKAVKYDALEGLPTDALLDSSKVAVRLADPNNYAPSEYTAEAPFKADFLTDGDLHTHWTARNWAGNEHIICEFKEPVDLQAVIWAPRLDGNYPNQLRAYSIQVWYKGEEADAKANKNGHLLVPDPNRGGIDSNGGSGGGDVHTWPNIPNRTQIPVSRYAILPFDPQKEVIQISVAVEQAGYQLVSCSELMFMQYDPEKCLPDQIRALFTDDLRTQLVSGVTETQITALEEQLTKDQFYYFNVTTLRDELALAKELLKNNGKLGAKSTVVDGIQSRSNGADSQKYSQAGSDLQPLGATATANQEIAVYASGIPENQSVTLYASQFNAEASEWRAAIGQVKNGRNIFTVPKIGSQNTQRGGSLYLSYSGDNSENIKLHVRRATDIPMLELADWYKIDEATRKARIEAYLTELDAYVKSHTEITDSTKTTSIFNVTEISTPVVLLSLPAKAVQGGAGSGAMAKRVQNVYNSVLAWEDLMHICKTTQGIDNTYEANDMQSRQNIRCMQMFAGAFMYAAGNHIGIGYGSCAGMVGGRPINQMSDGFIANNLFGWGIAHEIGHNMDKLGKAEITNNIYSIMVQTYDGQDNTLASRLEKSNKYPRVFEKVAQGYPGASNDVFTQLGMYWQLHLAYDEGKTTTDKDGPMNFYNKFFKAWKNGTYTKDFPNASADEKFALTASGVAGKDLTEFFTRWGMTLSTTVKDKLGSYGEEKRAIWYLNDQSRRDRLSGVSSVTGTVGASAAKKAGSDTEIEITITPPVSDHIQGYEIIRDDKPIAFVVPNNETIVGDTVVYTDTIGTGNHLAFDYKVAAYDTLGNKIGESEAGEVRVAYDKTVDPKAYTLTRSEDKTTATFELKEETAVSGIKLTGANWPASDDFTVTITGVDAQGNLTQPVEARRSTFDDTNNLAKDDPNSFLTYFNKPGTANSDTRIWTYDAKTVVITGLPADLADENIQLVSYAGDDVSFLEDSNGFVGRLSADYKYGDGADDVIKAGTLVIVGNYRGDPVYNTIRIMGKFTTTKASADPSSDSSVDEVTFEETERPLDGYALMFAEIPEDKEVSDISDGLFIFVPNVQKEAELQEITSCDGSNLLPSQIKAQLYRTDLPEDSTIKRETAETLWIHSPGGDELPTITLTQN
ncbi:MAG: hypothetical protein HFE80_09210 [Clostridiaceae bacterium]|jgi:hypothetical protein|nr:hypothetical protein [Clostridiaceae bacterium]